MNQSIKAKKTGAVPARERILKVAEDLFYRQGYKATGINQIIADSGVAKATFYSHFPCKDDLCLAYLTDTSAREIEMLKAQVEKCRTPLSKFLCLIESLEPWLLHNDLKGCGFLNIVPEITDSKSPLRKAGKDHYRWFENLQTQLAKDLIQSNRKKYGAMDPVQLAKDYIFWMTGALALVEIYHDIEPMRYAVKRVREMVR